MRNCLLEPGSNPKPIGVVQPFSEPDRAASVARLFAPSDLDLDDLAEAIRSLLRPGPEPQDDAADEPDRNLLSFAHRGTHVVEPGTH